jgi:hypothetical protein
MRQNPNKKLANDWGYKIGKIVGSITASVLICAFLAVGSYVLFKLCLLIVGTI